MRKLHVVSHSAGNRSPKLRLPLVLFLALVLVLGLVMPSAAQEQAPIDTLEPMPTVSPEATPESPTYVVQPGDTLYQIAQRFDSTVEAIAAANDIVNPRLIHVGQKLVIPTARPELVPTSKVTPNQRLHRVASGETLPFLAFRYGTTVWALREANDLGWFSLLAPGQELDIPLPIAPHTAVPSFPSIATVPDPIVQGQTMMVQIQGTGELELQAAVLGQDLHFVEGESSYWALVGLDSLTPPGEYPLAVTATEVDSGDVLTMSETITVTKGDYGTYNVVVPPGRSNLLDPGLSEAERRKVNAVFAGISGERLWEGAFGLPLAGELRTTAPFGQRRSYNGGPVSSYHSGQDFGADEGTPVYAPADGVVALAEPLQVRGQVVIIDHGLGVFSGFWHLSQIDVQAGQSVAEGEVVGLVGNTGLSTGPHLHWEMRVFNVPVDPLQWTRRAFP